MSIFCISYVVPKASSPITSSTYTFDTNGKKQYNLQKPYVVTGVSVNHPDVQQVNINSNDNVDGIWDGKEVCSSACSCNLI